MYMFLIYLLFVSSSRSQSGVSVMNPLNLSSVSDFDVSSQSLATRFPPRRQWLGTAGPSTTGRCRSPTSLSLLKASNRSTPTPSSNTRPWWGPLFPTHTQPAWWSSRSRGTSPMTQVSDLKRISVVCAPSNSSGKWKSREVIAARALSFQEWEKTWREGAVLLSLPIIRAGDLVGLGVCAVRHFLWCSNRKKGGGWAWSQSRICPPTLVRSLRLESKGT